MGDTVVKDLNNPFADVWKALDPKAQRKAMKGAMRKEANNVKKAAQEAMESSGIGKGTKQALKKSIYSRVYPDRYGLKELKDMISFGGSPRASISLAKASRAYAFVKRRGYVVPEDVRAVAHDVLRHRIGLTYEAEASNVTSEEIVSRIINKVEVP